MQAGVKFIISITEDQNIQVFNGCDIFSVLFNHFFLNKAHYSLLIKLVDSGRQEGFRPQWALSSPQNQNVPDDRFHFSNDIE